MLPIWLHQTGILPKVIDLAVDGKLNERVFFEMARARRNLPRYFLQLAKARPSLRGYCSREALKRDPNNREALKLYCKVLLSESRYGYALVIAQNKL
jgi:hypothetical protein